jgi:hypothetical protein
MRKLPTYIKDIDSLEREIYMLKREAKQLEHQLDENLDYLQQNYGRLTMNSVFSRARTGRELLSEKLTESIWSNEKFQYALNKVVNYFVDKTADGVEIMVDKIFTKKDETPEE